MGEGFHNLSTMEEQTFTIAPATFDLHLLPREAQTFGSPAFREAVSVFLQRAFQGFGGRVAIFVNTERIAVTWTPDPSPRKPLDVVIEKLRHGQQAEGIQLLELLLSRQPDDVNVLYNLGMALSDAGKLEKAEQRLRRAVELAPGFTNALIALGVALSRQQKDEEAANVLKSAVDLEPENPWAQRNLGVALLKQSRYSDAAECLQHAAALRPEDQSVWVALGDAFRHSGRAADAKNAYEQAIALNPHSDSAEAARQGSNQLARTEFERKAAGAPRPEVVDYCVAALKAFANLPAQRVQEIALEIAMLGRKGLDLNSSEMKYRLKSMEGNFSGLQLMSHMYVAFEQIAPGEELGFDLAREYRMARGIYEKEGPLG